MVHRLADGGRLFRSVGYDPRYALRSSSTRGAVRFDSNRAVPTRISRNERSKGGGSNGCSENSVELGR
jgi:hypothetical protein